MQPQFRKGGWVGGVVNDLSIEELMCSRPLIHPPRMRSIHLNLMTFRTKHQISSREKTKEVCFRGILAYADAMYSAERQW